ncbi:MAG: DUF4054 domain-containing protein [Plesiomonas shigelloides]
MTLDEWKAQYPDIAVDDPVISRYLDLFKCMFQGDYGCMTEYLQGLFVAHRVTMAAKGAGPVMVTTSRSVGDVSVSGEVAGLNRENIIGDYAGTRFGLEFWETISMYGDGIIMAQPYHG